MALLGVDCPAEQEQLARRPGADAAGEPLRPACARHQPQAHLREAQPGARIGDDEIAHECHLEAPSHRRRLHGGDEGLRQRREPVERPAAGRDVLLDRPVALEQPLELVEVGARHERLVAGPGEDDGAHAALRRERRRHVGERVEHRVAEGVHGRVVDRDDGDAVSRSTSTAPLTALHRTRAGRGRSCARGARR